MKLLNVIYLLLFFNISSVVSSQVLPYDTLNVRLNSYNLTHTEINYNSLYLVSASSIFAGLLIHNYQYQSWWTKNTSSFRMINSIKSNNWINKAGKFYSTNLIAHFYSASFEGAGIEYEKATLYSAGIALAYGLYVEVYDGFSESNRFNISEMLTNIIGAGYVLGQYYFPELKNFQPRFSYYSSNESKSNMLENKNVLSDFGGQKYWMGVRIKNYLPDIIKEYWPPFLMVSVGMGVNNFRNNGYTNNELFLALDFDAEEIPLYGDFWQFIKNTLNYLHFPMPGIRISPNTAAFLLCY